VPPTPIVIDANDVTKVIDVHCCGPHRPRKVDRGKGPIRQEKAVTGDSIAVAAYDMPSVIDAARFRDNAGARIEYGSRKINRHKRVAAGSGRW